MLSLKQNACMSAKRDQISILQFVSRVNLTHAVTHFISSLNYLVILNQYHLFN